MAGGIFISYRREDAPGYAGRLYDRLVAHFGEARVFMDVEGIEAGTDFVDAIERAVGACELLIVIIGHDWLAAGADGKRRLDDPADFVRLETAAALKRGIRVVPVLVEGAAMPRADQLPPDLGPLARRQAVEINHRQWDATSGQLIATLEKILGGEHPPAAVRGAESSVPVGAPKVTESGTGTRRYWAVGAAATLAAITTAVYFWGPWSEPTPQTAVLRVSPESVRFSDVPLQTAAPASIVRLQNGGPGTLHVQRLRVDGTHASDFSLGDDQCSGRELAPGAECSVKIGFRPQGTGERDASLAVAYEGTSAPANVALRGAGSQPVVAEAKPPVDQPPRKDTTEPPAKAPATKPETDKAPIEAPTRSPAKERPDVALEKPRIVYFESRRDGEELRLCYGVENAATATITPRPGAVRPSSKECVSIPASASGTFTLEARNAAGVGIARRLEVAAQVAPALAVATVSVPDQIGKTRKQAVAELEAAGLAVRVEESTEASASPPDTVIAQLPKAGESLKAGGRVTLHVRAASPPRAALAASLPRVGDRWQYRVTSVWRNVEPRTYVHQVTEVTEHEVRETMSVAGAADAPSASKSITAGTRYVEWRGNGFYVVEFNPFLQAFDALSPNATWQSLETPVADPFYSNWYGRGRVVGWESVTVPAGSFKALRVELDSSRKATASLAMQATEPVRIVHVSWYVPDAKRTVKQVRTVFAASGRKLDEDTFELVKYALQ